MLEEDKINAEKRDKLKKGIFTAGAIGVGLIGLSAIANAASIYHRDESGTITKIATNALNLTATPSVNQTVSGITINLTAHETQSFGDVCFINSSGEAQLGDADAIATASAIVMCADATISASGAGTYLLCGIARNDSWAWTVGGLIYLSTTGTTTNTLTQSAPSGTDDVIQIIGVATHADRIYFTPQLVQVEHV
ncbi:MAG: hypothetical protein WCW13_02565 [archaeon]|jgi:hypothetical protein